ncbi:hypothetical protein GCM10025875_01350 [Litorihabitans aurantiacus]|uniref:Uncharacterized protein n=1 Tax=Litorihabitans aurantiacus TaxID=1930061 RepID=A0AA37UMW7_9MICO|nr:hypothetical protein GCM10025875_01350 [Litorihabitans aurantiacus]
MRTQARDARPDARVAHDRRHPAHSRRAQFVLLQHPRSSKNCARRELRGSAGSAGGASDPADTGGAGNASDGGGRRLRRRRCKPPPTPFAQGLAGARRQHRPASAPPGVTTARRQSRPAAARHTRSRENGCV